MKLSELIKTYRLEHNLSLRAFAEKTICSFQYISNIEKEEVKNPSIPTLVSIAKAMDMSLDQLLKITDDFMIDIQLDGKGRIMKNGWQTGKRVSDVTGEVIDDDYTIPFPVEQVGLSMITLSTTFPSQPKCSVLKKNTLLNTQKVIQWPMQISMMAI